MTGSGILPGTAGSHARKCEVSQRKGGIVHSVWAWLVGGGGGTAETETKERREVRAACEFLQ